VVSLDSPQGSSRSQSLATELQRANLFSPPNGRVRGHTFDNSHLRGSHDIDINKGMIPVDSPPDSPPSLSRARSSSHVEYLRNEKNDSFSSSRSVPRNSPLVRLFGRRAKPSKKDTGGWVESSPVINNGQIDVRVEPDFATNPRGSLLIEKSPNDVTLGEIQTDFDVFFKDKKGEPATGLARVTGSDILVFRSKGDRLLGKNGSTSEPYYQLQLRRISEHKYAEDNCRVMIHYKWPPGSEGQTHKKALFQEGYEVITLRTKNEGNEFRHAINVAITMEMNRRSESKRKSSWRGSDF